MEISNSRRILAVSRPDTSLLDLIKELTPTTTSTISTDSIAGSTHNYRIKTSYYEAKVPIWLDEISEPEFWAKEFLAPEAREVLSVLGGFVVCFRKPTTKDELEGIKVLLKSVQEVVKEGCGYSWEGVCLAVGMKQTITPFLDISSEDWEDTCQDHGFEFIDFELAGKNEYKESQGVARLREALESNDWNADDPDLDDFDGIVDDFGEDDEGSLGLGIDPKETEEEMKGMKEAIYGAGMGIEEEGDHDDEVEQLQAMMMKMQAVRDLGESLPEAERKRLAAKTVNEIMKTM